MNLLPRPRSLKRGRGFLLVPTRPAVQLDASLPPEVAIAVEKRLLRDWSAGLRPGLGKLGAKTGRPGGRCSKPVVRAIKTNPLPIHPQSYTLAITPRGVVIRFHEVGGLRAAVATLRQLLREFGRRLPCLRIRDWPDFPRRGVMLDVSRGRVPRLRTLLELVDHLADFKINELQLYLEHTFAYRNYRPVWQEWGALTAREIRRLDARCRELGIDLVPNQNSLGHLRAWLEHPPLKELAEVAQPYEDAGSGFLRHPSTLAPYHPRTLPFLRGLYDEFLPNFSSRFFNVGCDEPWDLGRGRSKTLCEQEGKGRVYLDFLKSLHREVRLRGRRMMFWGDIVLQHPELIRELPKDAIALNWGYEANHPFDREAALFAKSKVPFYVCPGTSTWMTLIGRHDNALANLRAAARAGLRHGATGYLITDWGDGGHPQPLAVSYLPYLAGASLSWCANSFDETRLVPVLNRDTFSDSSGRLAGAARALGLAHRKFGFSEPNSTPFGTTLAAPPPYSGELFCRNGLKNYSNIAGPKVRAALAEVLRQRTVIRRSAPATREGRILAAELDLAARMAAQSCKFMLWQQTLADGENPSRARAMARSGIRELRELDQDFDAYWPARNKGGAGKCSAFLRWRIEDYSRAETKWMRPLTERPQMCP